MPVDRASMGLALRRLGDRSHLLSFLVAQLRQKVWPPLTLNRVGLPTEGPAGGGSEPQESAVASLCLRFPVRTGLLLGIAGSPLICPWRAHGEDLVDDRGESRAGGTVLAVDTQGLVSAHPGCAEQVQGPTLNTGTELWQEHTLVTTICDPRCFTQCWPFQSPRPCLLGDRL